MSSTAPIPPSEPPEEEEVETPSELPPHRSAMRERYGWFVEKLADHLFFSVVMNEAAVRKIRALSQAGTVVYALRHRSFIDFFLVNYILRREGLPLPVFANGVSATPLASAAELWRRFGARVMSFVAPGRAEPQIRSHDYCARALEEGRPVLVFMRGRRRRSLLDRALGRRKITSTRVGGDYLRELVHVHRKAGREHFIVPMALLRGHSFARRDVGLSALIYSVQDLPSDFRKLVTYWWNRKDLFITVGKEVALNEFMERYGSDGEERLARRLTRAIQIFLAREERVVQGPPLLQRKKVGALVLGSDEFQHELEHIAAIEDKPVAKLHKEAEGYFNEMAANFNGILFGIVAWGFKRIWGRMFTGITPVGFDAVIEKVRRHPIVIVPCHRSHLDYLILTYLFHLNFVSPPHIAAGINMAFWPMGPFLRASGAYYIRRTFADNEVYKLVFRHYLKFLIREGYTQEFFIEGGRSRTGKILTPKLGMLSALIEAYLSGIRGDLYLCPVSIHYGRIVEEDSYEHELHGGEKEAESFSGLLSARRFLKRNYGTVYLSFAEPISLKEALGDDRGRFSELVSAAGIPGAANPEDERDKRRFIQKMGFKILRDVNDCSVVGATSISSTVLLSAAHAGTRYEDYRDQANALAVYALQEGVQPTASLERNLGTFRESLGFLGQSGHVETIRRGPDEILVVDERKRLALDFYKNNLIHVFLIPSLIMAGLSQGKRGDDLVENVWWWLELFRFEFALPDRNELPDLIESFLQYARTIGAVEEDNTPVGSEPLVRALIPVLDCFREAYLIALRTVRDHLSEEPISEKALIDEYSKSFKAAQFLGEVTKPEAAVVVLFKNALSRFLETDLVVVTRSGRGGRERSYTAGTAHETIPETLGRVEECLRVLARTRHYEESDVTE